MFDESMFETNKSINQTMFENKSTMFEKSSYQEFEIGTRSRGQRLTVFSRVTSKVQWKKIGMSMA